MKFFLDFIKLYFKNLSLVFENVVLKFYLFFLEVYWFYIEFGENEVCNIFCFLLECNFIYLGYFKSKFRGKGVFEKMFFNFFKKISGFIFLERKNLFYFILIVIFVLKFVEDRIFDFFVSFLKKEIVEYLFE